MCALGPTSSCSDSRERFRRARRPDRAVDIPGIERGAEPGRGYGFDSGRPAIDRTDRPGCAARARHDALIYRVTASCVEFPARPGGGTICHGALPGCHARASFERRAAWSGQLGSSVRFVATRWRGPWCRHGLPGCRPSGLRRHLLRRDQSQSALPAMAWRSADRTAYLAPMARQPGGSAAPSTCTDRERDRGY